MLAQQAFQMVSINVIEQQTETGRKKKMRKKKQIENITNINECSERSVYDFQLNEIMKSRTLHILKIKVNLNATRKCMARYLLFGLSLSLVRIIRSAKCDLLTFHFI